ncbi:MAG: primosomal protein N', partial [Victivallales bacterium]|nr:primosomal protein N' [Victivallales bacterium]
MSIARIIVDLSLDKTFDYHIPPTLEGRVVVGSQVNVPFGRSYRRGYVLAIGEHSDYPERLKDVISLCESHTRIPPLLVQLGEWMADYYCCSREQAVCALLPHAVRSGRIKQKSVARFGIADVAAAEKYVAENKERKAAAGQVAILKILLSNPEMTRERLIREHHANASSLNTLRRKGLLHEDRCRIIRDAYEHVEIIPDRPLQLTSEQAAAMVGIRSLLADRSCGHTVLLHGVTGSGKTEIYLQAIALAIEAGLESIVLVPEIALTPQTVRRFRARFGNMVSVLHSGLSDGERFDEWTKVHEGVVKIAVGARSALFAPFLHLGLIIVDEEHENSYKQSEAPRYHARDVAVMRGHMEKALVILGSATPSFESYCNALNGKYELLELTQRVDQCVLPAMKVIDVRMDRQEQEEGERQSGLFTKMLITAIKDRLWRGEQTILFLNRRGYALQMMCEQCGYVANCPDCSVPYTYHLKTQTLICHLCGDTIAAPSVCPDCGAEEIRYSGSGTEKVEIVARKLFPEARVARMDSDTMKTNDSYEQVLSEFRRGNLDILIGTQMIAKGLHFPNVTLVGIINADQSLYIPDFRSPERTFQLITQVAGRAGRGDIKGEVLIQTFSPFNDTIRFAVNNDFRGFYESDMEVRQLLKYPPCGHLIAVYFQGEDAAAVGAYATRFMEYLRPACHEDMVIGEPGPAPIEKIKAKYRYLIVFRGDKLQKLRKFVRHYVLSAKHPKGVHVYADVDAQSLR